MTIEHLNAKPSWPERTVLIGASGFVGQAVKDRLLQADTTIVPISSREVDLTNEASEVILADILKPGDAVVVSAAITPDKGRGTGTFLSNFKMISHIAAVLERVEPAHVVYVSSDAVYPLDVTPVNEASAVAPEDLYGAMHLSREIALKSEVKAPLAILRPTLIFGAGDTHNSYGPNRLRRMARDKGTITLFGGGEETRDHVYIDDVAALMALMLSHKSHGLLNVATGRSISYLDLAHKVAGLFDGDVDVELTPRQNPITHRSFDITNLRKAFPQFGFTPLDDGLRQAHAGMLAEAS